MDAAAGFTGPPRLFTWPMFSRVSQTRLVLTDQTWPQWRPDADTTGPAEVDALGGVGRKP